MIDLTRSGRWRRRFRTPVGLVVFVAISALIVEPAGARPSRLRAVASQPGGAWPAIAVGHETSFVADINALRASQNLPALRVRPELTRKARGWAATMAGAGRIWHSRLPNGIRSDWWKLGENVGRGGSEPALHAAFVASGSHLRNLVDPAFTTAGVGVVVAGDIIYVSEVFMRAAPTAYRRVRPATRLGLIRHRSGRRPVARPPGIRFTTLR